MSLQYPGPGFLGVRTDTIRATYGLSGGAGSFGACRGSRNGTFEFNCTEQALSGARELSLRRRSEAAYCRIVQSQFFLSCLSCVLIKLLLLSVLVENETSVGAAEAKGIGHDTRDRTVFAFGEDWHALCLVNDVYNIGRLGEEVVVHHEE